MRSIRSLVYGLAAFAGAPRLWQRAFVRNGATVLMYHAVTKTPLTVSDWCFVEEQDFRDQMFYLHGHCDVIPLRDLQRALAAPPARPIVALTFDDGFRNNHAVAFPILRELGLSATIFLASDFVDSNDTPWFCRINDGLSRTALTQLRWGEQLYDLSTPALRAEANAALQLSLKRYTQRDLLARTQQLLEALGVDPHGPISGESPYRMLETHEIREMYASGLIDFGAHSCSHAILSHLPAAQRRAEISGSLAAVERLTGAPCRLFAYPNGRACDYGAFDTAELAHRQVEIAVTTVVGPNYPSAAPLELRRYGVGAHTPLAQFKLLTHHVLWKLRN